MGELSSKISELWWKLLVAALVVCGPAIVIGFLYSRNSSCIQDPWNCLGFDVIMISGGVMLFCLPIAAILFAWEVYKKIKKKKEEY